MRNIKIVSWNIAGGYPVASLDQFDYQSEDVGYFADQIKALQPDVVCLQESHTSLDGNRSIAHEIAKSLGFTHIFNSPASPSHINSDYQLGNAILAKDAFVSEEVYWYPDPEMELFFSNGKKAITHKKNLQIVKFEKFSIANTQMLPITLFGYAYDDGKEGSNFASQINSVMRNVKAPVVWGGDFNFNDPKSIYSNITSLGLIDGLPDEVTRPSTDGKKRTPDHIFYSPEFNLVDSSIVQTNSDHYLCYVEVEI